MLERVSPSTLAALAFDFRHYSLTYFGVGIDESHPLVHAVTSRLRSDETLVVIEEHAGVLNEIETPEGPSWICVWCNAGCLIDCTTTPESIPELMDEARQFV